MSTALKVWVTLLVVAVLAYGSYRWLPRGGEVSSAEKDPIEVTEVKVKPGEVPVDLTQYTMTERTGKPYNFAALKGEVWVANMFFASCPHRCGEMTRSVASLHNDTNLVGVKFVSISVDPATDTPEELAKYADLHKADKERWLFMQGTAQDVREFGKEMGAVATYRNHEDRLGVFDRTGRYRGGFLFNSSAEIHLLKGLLAELLAEPVVAAQP